MDELNRMRVSVVRWTIPCYSSAAALAVLVISARFSADPWKVYAALALFAICFILCGRMAISRAKYLEAFRSTFVKQALESELTSVHYEPEEGLPSQAVAEAVKFMADRYRAENYVFAQ